MLKSHGQPRTITLDGFEPTHSALRRMGMRNEFNFRWENPVRIRSCQYSNNVVEQDHRRIKSRVQPMLGFKKFYNARPDPRRLTRSVQIHHFKTSRLGQSEESAIRHEMFLTVRPWSLPASVTLSHIAALASDVVCTGDSAGVWTSSDASAEAIPKAAKE